MQDLQTPVSGTSWVATFKDGSQKEFAIIVNDPDVVKWEKKEADVQYVTISESELFHLMNLYWLFMITGPVVPASAPQVEYFELLDKIKLRTRLSDIKTTVLLERISTLFPAIAHGDENHRKWLKEAIEAHFMGKDPP